MLDELRRKSPYVKQSYAFWGAVGVTSLVVVGWVASLPVRFGNLNTVLDGEAMNQTAGGVTEILDDLKGFKEGASEAFRAATATSSAGLNDQNGWALDSSADGSTATQDPVLIATSSKPTAPPPKSIQIATSSAPNR